MPSSFLTSSSSSASSHLSYLIPARPPPPLAMGQGQGQGQGYGGATGGIISVPTTGVVANAMNAAAAPPPPRQGRASRNAGAGHPPLPRPPPRQCPRCQSANTKFCYYNNYSREQPRYLCKACRRHWTEGGTLRDVPVGGGRKNRRGAKGSAKAASASTAAATTQGGNVLGVGADTFPDFLRQLVQFPSAAAVGGGGYAIDLSAWQQMTAATAPPMQGTGDASTLGAAGMAAEAEANCVALQYWSEWQQDGMPGLDGAC